MPATQTINKSPIAGAAWPKLTLTPQQRLKWDECRTAFLWAVPSFSDIWMAMMCDKDGTLCHFTDQIETAATDDKFLYVNPTFFFGLTLDEKIFVDCHEVGHAMFGHAGLMYLLEKQGFIRYNDGVELKFNHDLMNSAMDYVLDDQIVKAKIGKMPEGGLHWPDLITGDMSVLDAYRLLYKENGGAKPPKPQCQRSTDARGKDKGEGSGKSFDKLMKPGEGRGKTPNKAMSERNESEWTTTIQSAMTSAKLRGQLPANLDRIFSNKLQPKADWRDLYQLAVSKKIGNDRYTWDRLDPQLIWRGVGAPGRTSHGCNTVIIAVDTSGSISQRTLDVFMAETAALLDQARPKRVILAQCDAQIHEWRDIETDELADIKLKGGGGTMFEPVFERAYAEGEQPDLLIYLTDLMGSFPSNPPSYPTIWGCIDAAYAKSSPPPFGEVVMVPPQTGEVE